MPMKDIKVLFKVLKLFYSFKLLYKQQKTLKLFFSAVGLVLSMREVMAPEAELEF